MNILDLLFPKRCLGCGVFDDYICSSCQKHIVLIDFPVCPVCNRQAVDGVVHPGCRGRFTPDGLFTAFRYRGVIRQAIKRLKYKPRMTDLRYLLVTLSIAVLKENEEFKKFIAKQPTVVPVPIHWLRKILRGYNQSAIIGETLAKSLGLAFKDNVLLRKHYTRPQYGLKKKKREENVKRAFELRCKLAKNKAVLLVDDVWTTGTTMKACTNVLKRAGVKQVWCLAIAG